MSKRISRVLCVLLIFTLVAATSVMAAAPKIMSYQGRATDASGNPVTDGPHTVAFDMYNSVSAGSRLWGEITTVTTSGGLFTHTLGSVTPILESQFRYSEGLWLQVTFDGEVQTPRTQFTSVGYAFHVQSIHNAEGGNIKGYVAIYDATADGEIGGIYGDINGEPILWLDGSERSIELNAGQPADGSVSLPDGAINSLEIKNEPGIAYNVETHAPSGLVIQSSNFIDLVTVTISIPAPGYIVLNGQAHFVQNPLTRHGWVMQIDETAGGDATTINSSASFWNQGDNEYNTGYCQSVYYKGTAGNYTFRVEGVKINDDPAGCYTSTLLAMYVPTSYGTVVGLVSAENASKFDSAETVQDKDGNQFYKVDLRDLELRAAHAEAEAQRARADAEKAQRELLRAKYESSEWQNR